MTGKVLIFGPDTGSSMAALKLRDALTDLLGDKK